MNAIEGKIVSELKSIERKQQVRILYACESGSRSWGFPSKDSDYDVRFIYIHPTNWYLAIDEKRDVIENPVSGILDISGWDIRKTLKLFRKSNPPLLEWLESPIVYLEQFGAAEKLRKLASLFFSPSSCLHHYLHMAEGNFKTYLRGERVRVKKYFYVLRPVLACKWIEKYNTMPPMEFEKLVNPLIPAGRLARAIKKLLQRKKAGSELDIEPRITVFNKFLDNEILHLNSFVKSIKKTKSPNRAVLDKVFRDSLKEVW